MNKGLEDLVDLMFDTDMEEVMKEKSTLEYIHKLQQENKQLKDDFDFNLGAIENLRKENHKLENKIDKAIEYIKNNYLYYYDRLEPIELKQRYLDDIMKLNEILGDKE